MRSILLSSALGLVAAFASSTAVLANDGFFNVSYNDISINLTQIGGYGELTVSPQGFKGMGYGDCIVNFTRDDAGKPLEMAPVIQRNSATCPEALGFEVKPGKSGLYDITFTEGGPLKGKTLELFPVLVPMTEELRITAPKGFDILGMTIGQTRAEVEAVLTEKGYSRVEAYEETASYQGGFTKASSLWGKGARKHDENTPADQISITYTALFEGEAGIERVEYLGRKWYMGAEENLSLANLQKSLEDKHGKTTSGFESRFYNRKGELQPKSFQPVCDETVHLQNVETSYSYRGTSGDESLSPACGAHVKIMTGEDMDAKGRAGWLDIALAKADVAYESFWATWSRNEAKELQARYELQANMKGDAPDL